MVWNKHMQTSLLINDGDVVLSFGSPTGGVRLPEPSTLLLLAFGLAGLGLLRRKRAESSWQPAADKEQSG